MSDVPLVLEPLTTVAALEALAPEWDRLDALQGVRTPYTSPLWNLLWWKHFREERRSVRDDLYVHALRDGHGELVAVAPLMLTQHPGVGALRHRTVQFFGADRNLTELRGLVCRPGHESRALCQLRRHLRARAGEWDQIQWQGIGEPVAARCAFDPEQHIRWDGATVDYWLPLHSTWDHFRASRPRNVREALRKCYNSLRRAGLTHELRVVSSPQQVPQALDGFFELHTARAHGPGSVAHPDVFAGAHSRAFLTEYVQRMADRGRLRLFQLHIAGTVVATRIGFAQDRQLYLYYSGYHPEWGRYSVMTTLLAESIRWALAQGMEVLNLSTGTDVSKTRWRPERATFWRGVEHSPIRRRQLLSRAYEQLRRVTRASSHGRRALGALLRGG